MNRWFRFYDDAINDPKVVSLSDECYRGWVGLLCVASKHKGVLPPVSDLAFYLRMKPNRVATLIAQLVSAKLLDRVGDAYEPHNWGGRQYISDSTERVKRHREKRAAAGLMPQWQPSKDLRKEVYARDNFECVYCQSPEDLTVDHKTPELRGGTHDVSNLQTACRACNASKRDLTHDEFVTRNVTSSFQERPQTTDNRNKEEQKQSRPRAAAVSNSEKVLRSDLAEAFGPTRDLDLARAAVWLAKGYTHTMILEVVKEVLARGTDVASLNYFDGALAERHASREETPSERAETAAAIDMDKVAEMFKKTGVWSKYAGPEPGMMGCRCPTDILAKHGIAVPGMRRMDA